MDPCLCTTASPLPLRFQKIPVHCRVSWDPLILCRWGNWCPARGPGGKVKTVGVCCDGGFLPQRELCAKRGPMRGCSGDWLLYCSGPSSVSLDSGITLRAEEKGPMPWRTLAACGHLENSQASSASQHRSWPSIELWARLCGAQSVGSRLIPRSMALLPVLLSSRGRARSAGSSCLRHASLSLWSNAAVSLLNNCDRKPSLIRHPCLPSSKGWSLSISEKLTHFWSCLRTLELLSFAFISINSISNLLPNRYSLLL